MTITIGGFDGMHIGHMKLIRKADAYLVIEKNSNLTPGFDRIYYSPTLLDILYLEKIKNLSAIEFIEILKKYNAQKIIVGDDFRFGKNRSGDIELLKKFFEVEVIHEIKINNIGIHSHYIRTLIKNGEIKKANKFLGHIYKIKGIKIKGQGLGSKELFPTINITPFKNYFLPKAGVYITKTNGYQSITFIGTRSTDKNFSIETHILEDFEDNSFFEIEFLEFLRENIYFRNLNQLKNQIAVDIIKATNFFRNY
ncbi:bifunctional riboflavin kinase/FAD synthetase [Caminibacter mediatlanticus TB-2]|uniref:Bifunctional riboflavin kinase/FAD synthetase n=1 Tax=Caminibacter mediatlanticus TB-2 TaxID=391592 RepID=A0ABX5V8Y8_9BACT|nr:bifunctional riboflavin kinase/FAD synthetase [Caminibacter mediatlanticus]QCT94681.1 bifunctional riboflavin kinase/FAD synthetase [Caminibacter mediatlanticus TB-2]